MELKAVAIEQEDYEVAKRLKFKIEEMRNHISNAYGIDSENGKIFEKSGFYREINIEPVNYQPEKRDDFQDQMNELVDAVS